MTQETDEKPWRSYSDQLAILRSRGMIIEDQEKAIRNLDKIGYYRLSGYWYPFRQIIKKELLPKKGKQGNYLRDIRSDNFIEGVNFTDIVDLYAFDKDLRLLCFDALSVIEISIRSKISYLLGQHSAYSYLEKEYFLAKSSKQHDKWLEKHEDLIGRSKEHFIQHNKEKYGLPLKIWVASEIWDFGALSILFSMMLPDDKDAIAKQYGVSDGLLFSSWLRSLNYLRNVCAHHSRLWNLNILNQPQLSSNKYTPDWISYFFGNNHKSSRVAPLLFILRDLLTALCPDSKWSERLTNQLLTFPKLEHLGINYASMGFDGKLGDWNGL